MFLAFLNCMTFAQEPHWYWAVSAGGSNQDFGNAIATDASGNVIVTGEFNSPSIVFGTTTLVNAGNRDIFTVKYDGSGNVLWAVSAGGSDDDYGESVSTDSYGNIYITGMFRSSSVTFGSTILTNSGGYDVYVTKYNSSGTVLWSVSAQGGGNEYGNSIAADASGNVYVTGQYESSPVIFGSFSLVNMGTRDMFLVKYNSAGVVVWANRAGGAQEDQGYGVAADNSGNVFLTGVFGSASITFGSTTLSNSGVTDLFLVKYNASGAVVWAKSAGGTNTEWTFGISVDLPGNAFITGYFQSPTIQFGSFTLINSGSSGSGAKDIYIAKYDPAGTVLWAKNAKGTNDDSGRGISTDPFGNVYITGDFLSQKLIFGTDTLVNSGGYDTYVAKYDQNGSVAWAKNMIGAYSEDGFGISVDGAGNVYHTGRFQSSPLDFDGNQLFCAGSLNVFVGKISLYASNNGPVCAGSTLSLSAGTLQGASYSWNGPNGFTSALQNPVVSSNATPAMSGEYHVTATLAGGVQVGKTSVVVNGIPNTPTAGNNGPVCEGTALSLTASTVPGASYHWTGPNGFTSNLQNPVVSNSATPALSGTYEVTSMVNNCTSTYGGTDAIVNPLPVPPVAANNGPVCIGTTLSLTASSINGASYHWTGPAGFTSSIQNPVVSDSALTVMSGTYSVAAAVSQCTGPSGATAAVVKPRLSPPEICIVSVDSGSSKNVVYWERAISTAIDHYNVYSEGTQANVYNLIGSVPYDSAGRFLDEGSIPLQQANRYKISVSDTCSVESDLSQYHMTIHLNINQGVGNSYNLIWNNYEGFYYPSYKIYRGTSPADLSLLSTVPSNVTSYTDLSSPTGYIYYQVEVVRPVPCMITRSEIASSKSNISTNNPFTFIQPDPVTHFSIQVFPNPASDLVTITSKSEMIPDHVYITDYCGRELISQATHNQVSFIDVTTLPPGIYFVKLVSDREVYFGKMVKE